MKPLLCAFIFLSSLFMLLGITIPKQTYAMEKMPTADFSSLTYTGQNEVVRIVAPHLIQLGDGEIVKLAGLSFPDNDINAPGDLAVTTVNILKDLLVGRTVELYQTNDKNLGRMNRMGHQIAHLKRKDDGVWVQGVLLALGLARVYTTPRNPEMSDQMYALESIARNNKTGLWEDKNFALKTPETLKPYEKDFVVLEGKIKSSSIRNNRYYINFGNNWRDDFTLSVSPADKRIFSLRGLDPLTWNGKTVRVRGWVRSYNGPYMELTHPEQIEFIDTEIKASAPVPTSLHHTAIPSKVAPKNTPKTE